MGLWRDTWSGSATFWFSLLNFCCNIGFGSLLPFKNEDLLLWDSVTHMRVEGWDTFNILSLASLPNAMLILYLGGGEESVKAKVRIKRNLSCWFLMASCPGPRGCSCSSRCVMLADQGPVYIADTMPYGQLLPLYQTEKTMFQETIFTWCRKVCLPLS